MFIYCLEIHLSLQSHSLKEKRGIVKSILGRVRNRFNVACAEVDRQDNAGVAVLGFVTVSHHDEPPLVYGIKSANFRYRSTLC